MTLDSFFEPHSIAVIGASRDEGKVGNVIMQNLKKSFDGIIYPINPKADEVLGLKSYASVTEIDSSIDHAVIAVPPQVANTVIRECIEKDVDAITVITSGYQEIGEDGQERQEELEQLLEDTDTRLIGPNCLGIWDAYSGVDTMFLSDEKVGRPDPGSIALISQSGSVGSSFMDLAAEARIGISRFVSYGNQADVEEREILEWLEKDDKTDAIAIYMEGAKNGRAFYQALDTVTTTKPVIILKAGKTAHGSEAASSHTGSLAGSYRVYNGVFKQAGAVEANDPEELFDLAKELAYEDRGDGNRVAVITNGGGYGVLAADAIGDSDLELAAFSDDSMEQLRELIPSYGNVNNPLDVLGDADPETFGKALEILDSDENVDMILPITLLQPAPMDVDIVTVLEEFNAEGEKPLAVCMIGGEFTSRYAAELERAHVPVFQTPGRATAALQSLHRYASRKKK